MWIYTRQSGALQSSEFTLVGYGYSGNGAGLNNPAMQEDVGVGPIPAGTYAIGPFFDDPGGKGPVVAHLTPLDQTQMFGRSGFMIHGDNVNMNHSASHGCIILPRSIRQQIADSGDTLLKVV